MRGTAHYRYRDGDIEGLFVDITISNGVANKSCAVRVVLEKLQIRDP